MKMRYENGKLFLRSPLVSVIIPTYNRAGRVAKAIESVLEQTYPAIKLIVVDDGSTDQTHQLISNYLSRLHYLVQENRGVSAARNLGIKNSQGEYIALLDSDDHWFPDKISRQVAVMEKHPEIAICHTEETWYRRGVRVNPRRKHRKHGGWVFLNSIPLCCISPSAALIRREILDRTGAFDESLPACEDYDLWLRITRDYPVYLIKDPLVAKYGGHADQQSKRYWGMDRFRVYALVKILSELDPETGQWEPAYRMLIKKCRILASGYRKRGKQELAGYYEDLPEKVLTGPVDLKEIINTWT